MAKILPGSDPVHKVTIIPRGPTLGLTWTLPAEDRLSYSRSWAENRIAMALGGRIAEELVFGEMTTGAGNDLEQATDLARRMVCEWGMSEKMGPLTFGKKEGEVFLGRDFGSRADYSEDTARLIDAEVKRIVSDGYMTARKLLEENLDKLKLVADALLEHETIDGEDIERLMRGLEIERPAAGAAAAAAPPAVEVAVKEKRPLFGRPPLPEPEKA